MEQNAKPQTETRRRHLPEFKARVVDECARPGASVAAVALSHGLNANLVHRWRRQARQVDFCPSVPAPLTAPAPALAAPQQQMPPSSGVPVAPLAGSAMTRPVPVTLNSGHSASKGGTPGTFIALAHPTVVTLDVRTAPTLVDQAHSIHIDIQRTHAHIHIRWPTSAASDCALWLKDLLHDPQHEPPQDPYQSPRHDVLSRGAPK